MTTANALSPTLAPFPNSAHSALQPASNDAAAKPGRVGLRVWIIAAIVLLGAGGFVLWRQVIRWDYVEPRNWAAVEQGQIYRSGQVSRHLIRPTLSEHKIGAIIFMSEDKADRPDVQAEAAAAADMGIERYNFSLTGDGTGNPQRYVDAVQTMARCVREGRPVLVHCHTGAQRTGGAVALYRMLVQGRSGKDAYNELVAYGHDPEDNPKLVPYLNQNMPAIAKSLADRGVIAAVPADLPHIGP